MITQSDYNRRTDKQWRGVKVRALRPLDNGWITIPAGTICTIDGKFGGFSLRTDRCNCCGVTIRISRVPHDAVEIFHPQPGDKSV